jgi:hypothetical protein
MEICALSSNEEIPELDHVLVVKLGSRRFEVSGTAGCERTDADFLKPVMFEQQTDAMNFATQFASAHELPTIFVKGFTPPSDEQQDQDPQ